MWVLLRLLTALIIGLLRFFWRRSGGGEQKRTGGIDWRLKQARNKGRIVSTTFGVPCPHPLFFRLTEEDFCDRFFKRVGFTREVQTGDAGFDTVVYVSCDHPAITPILQEDAAARAAIVSLLGQGAKRIFNDGEILWVPRSGDTPPTETELRELTRIRDALAMVPPDHLLMLRDPFFWKALLVESIAWSLVLYGAPTVIEIATRSHPQYFDWMPVIKTGLLISVGIFALLFGLSWWLLRGSSRAHVLTESLVALLIGVPLSSIQMVSDVNIALDDSAPTIIEQRVVDKYTRITRSSKGRSRTHYHLRLRGTSPEALVVPADIEVAGHLYHRAEKDGTVHIKMRSGAAGIPWVEEMGAGRRRH